MNKNMIATSIGEILDYQGTPSNGQFLQTINSIIDSLDTWREDIDFSNFYDYVESIQIELEIQIYGENQGKKFAVDEVCLLKREFNRNLRKFTFPSYLARIQKLLFSNGFLIDSDVLVSFIERLEYKQAFEFLDSNLSSFKFFSEEDREIVNSALVYYRDF